MGQETYRDYQLGLLSVMRFYMDYLVFLNRLQLVQNRAARIVTFTKKYEHIAPSLIELHWLPVEFRIIYKISLLVYKAVKDFHQDIYPICSVFVTAPSLCVLARISYFKSQELS